jgi:DNA-binding CsgD family transcriptional regulator
MPSESPLLPSPAADLGMLLTRRPMPAPPAAEPSGEIGMLAAALDCQGVAISLHGPDGQARFLNRAMHRLLRTDTTAFTPHGSFGVVPAEPVQRSRYAASLLAAAHGRPAEMPLLRGEGPPPYMVCFQPMEGMGAMVTILDPSRRRLPSQAFLREAFGFTAAEAALALDLADGLAAADCASLRGVSVHTVRSQLRALFAKTGLCRQAELVSLILTMGLQQAGGQKD